MRVLCRLWVDALTQRQNKMQSNNNSSEENNSVNNSKVIPKFEVSVIEENELNTNQNNTEIVSPFIVQLEEGFNQDINWLLNWRPFRY